MTANEKKGEILELLESLKKLRREDEIFFDGEAKAKEKESRTTSVIKWRASFIMLKLGKQLGIYLPRVGALRNTPSNINNFISDIEQKIKAPS